MAGWYLPEFRFLSDFRVATVSLGPAILPFFPRFSRVSYLFPLAQQARFGLFVRFGEIDVSFSRKLGHFLGANNSRLQFGVERFFSVFIFNFSTFFVSDASSSRF